MKRIILIFTLLSGVLRAATGDVTVTVNPDGWSASVFIAGFTSGATYAFGLSGNNVTGANTPYFTVVSTGYTTGTTTLATNTFTVYLDHTIRFPYGTISIPGTYTSGTFSDGETITEAVTGATAIVVGIAGQSSGALLIARALTGSPTTAHAWTGGTSGAIFAQVGTHSTLAASTPNEEVSSTGLTVQVSLSDYIFQKDNTGGGNSGTAPTVTIPAAFVTNTAGASQTSNALSAAAVTQNSTAAYQMPLGQWDHIAGVCHADMVTGAYNVACNANALYGIASVRFDATGQTSTTNVNSTVGTQVAVLRSATGLYANAYQTNFSVSGFTTNELITLRFRVYPLRGDTTEVLDTENDTTVNDEPYGYTRAVIVYNATPKYGYVDNVSGNNSNTGSTTKATAIAAPFLNIGKAIQNDCTIILLKTGQTHNMVGVTSTSRRTTNQWYVVQPEDGHTSADTTVTLDTVKTYRCQRLRVDNVTVNITGTNCWMDGEANDNNVRFTNCIFNHGAIGKPTTNMGYQSTSAKFENCTGDLGVTNWALENFSSARINFQFDGCQFSEGTTTQTGIGPWYRVVACTSTGPTCFATATASNITPIPDNLFFEHNKIFGYNNSASYGFQSGDTRAIARGASIRGNAVEQLIGGQPFWWIGADGTTASVVGILFENNSLAGGRANFGYNDAGTVGYVHKFWGMKNNLLESWATKHDTFGTPNGNRTLAWSVLYGVASTGNFSPHIANIGASGSFMFEFIGLNSYQPSSSGQPPAGSTNVTAYVKFTNRQAYIGPGANNGAGGGAYTLLLTSPAHPLTATITDPFDFTGKTRTSSDDPGAYVFTPASSGNFFMLF